MITTAATNVPIDPAPWLNVPEPSEGNELNEKRTPRESASVRNSSRKFQRDRLAR